MRAHSRLTVSGSDVTPDGPAATDFHSVALLWAAGCSLSSLSEVPLSKIIVAATMYGPNSPCWHFRQWITGQAGDAARHVQHAAADVFSKRCGLFNRMGDGM